MKKSLLSILCCCSFALHATELTGVRWTYLSELDMMGMKLAMKPVTQCETAQVSPAPPMDGECRYEKITTSGNTTTFEFVCVGEDAAKGTGHFTTTENSRTGSYSLETADGNGTVTIQATKGPACDPAEGTTIDGQSVEAMKKRGQH